MCSGRRKNDVVLCPRQMNTKEGKGEGCNSKKIMGSRITPMLQEDGLTNDSRSPNVWHKNYVI